MYMFYIVMCNMYMMVYFIFKDKLRIKWNDKIGKWVKNYFEVVFFLLIENWRK